MSTKKYHRLGIYLKTGGRIRKIRGDLNQAAFGSLFGVKQNTVSKWEKGTVPDEETLKKIANYGKVTVEWLLRGNEPGSLAPQLRDFSQEEYVSSLNPLETALLIEVVTTVEAVLTISKQQFTPAQKARLIVRTYDDCRAQKIPPTRHHVEKLLYLED